MHTNASISLRTCLILDCMHMTINLWEYKYYKYPMNKVPIKTFGINLLKSIVPTQTYKYPMNVGTHQPTGLWVELTQITVPLHAGARAPVCPGLATPLLVYLCSQVYGISERQATDSNRMSILCRHVKLSLSCMIWEYSYEYTTIPVISTITQGQYIVVYSIQPTCS